MNYLFNKTFQGKILRNTNATIIPAEILHVVQNKGVIAAIVLFFIAIFVACLIKRIMTIRKSKSALKQKFMKITDVQFGDDIEDLKHSKYGDIRFSIDYVYDKGALKIGDISITGLQSVSEYEIDSYVIVSIEPDLWKLKPKKTSTIHKTNSPNFTKKFFFRIPMLDLNRVTVIFEIFDLDVFGSSDTMLGFARFDVSSLTQEEMEEFPVERRMPIDPPIDHDEGVGEICVVLKHFPLMHILNVTILEAKRLPIEKSKKLPPVFVSVTMFHKNNALKTRNTAIKYNTREPFFSQTFPFHLKPVKTPYTFLVIKVIKKSILGINSLVGQVEIGCDSHALSGRNHWKLMVASPKVAVASWHTLCKKLIK